MSAGTANVANVALCVWCRDAHTTRLQLCPKCEELAKRWRQRDNLPLREVPTLDVREEPDD